MIYLASPYSSPLPEMREFRIQKAREFTLALLESNFVVYSPLVAWDDFAKRYNLPTDAGFWMKLNFGMLRHAEGIFNLQLPGWEKSQGVSLELKMAKTLGIPIQHYDTNFQPITEQ